MRGRDRIMFPSGLTTYAGVLVATAGCGHVAMCAEYLSKRMFSCHLGHCNTFISDRTFLPFQFLPLSFSTPLFVQLRDAEMIRFQREISATYFSLTADNTI